MFLEKFPYRVKFYTKGPGEAEGGGGFAADKKEAADAAGCVEGLRKKVLKMDRPWTHLRCEGS